MTKKKDSEEYGPNRADRRRAAAQERYRKYHPSDRRAPQFHWSQNPAFRGQPPRSFRLA